MLSLHASVYLILFTENIHIYYNAVYAYWGKISRFLTDKLSLLFYNEQT